MLLEKYRNEFCYNDKDGQSYLHTMDRIKAFLDEMKEKEKKEKDPIFQKAMTLKKLKVSELKKRLEKALKKKGFENLQFDKSEMGQFVIIP